VVVMRVHRSNHRDPPGVVIDGTGRETISRAMGANLKRSRQSPDPAESGAKRDAPRQAVKT
jgi:hypothetical protein